MPIAGYVTEELKYTRYTEVVSIQIRTLPPCEILRKRHISNSMTADVELLRWTQMATALQSVLIHSRVAEIGASWLHLTS